VVLFFVFSIVSEIKDDVERVNDKNKNNKNLFKWKHFIYVMHVSKRENKYRADNLLSGIIVHFFFFFKQLLYGKKLRSHLGIGPIEIFQVHI